MGDGARESKSQESDDITTVQKGKQSRASKNTSAAGCGGKRSQKEHGRERERESRHLRCSLLLLLREGKTQTTL